MLHIEHLFRTNEKKNCYRQHRLSDWTYHETKDTERFVWTADFEKCFTWSMAGWLHSWTCRPPELHLYDTHTYKHQIYPGKPRVLSIKAYAFCPKCFNLCGLDKNLIINFMRTKEEKLILTVLLMHYQQINYSDCTDYFRSSGSVECLTNYSLAGNWQLLSHPHRTKNIKPDLSFSNF